jgi:hypothetical protein
LKCKIGEGKKDKEHSNVTEYQVKIIVDHWFLQTCKLYFYEMRAIIMDIQSQWCVTEEVSNQHIHKVPKQMFLGKK